MSNLTKQIMDFKWLLDRSSNLISEEKLNKAYNILLKADDTDNSAYLENLADQWLTAGGAPKESTPAPITPASQATQLAQKEQPLHQIHHDEDFRNTLKDYAKDYLHNEYSKIIRDAEASENPDQATTGHAYHLANPQHGHGATQAIHGITQKEEFNKLSPREQHRKLAETQHNYWMNNPNHKDEFVSSGRERNEYANAAKLVRQGKIQGEQEDIGRGGQTIVSDDSNMSTEEAAQATGGITSEGGTQTSFQQTPQAKMATSNPTASKIFASESQLRTLKDMMSHNAAHGSDNVTHQQRLDRMKGIKPHMSQEEAQEKISQVAGKQEKIREQSTQQARQSSPGSAISLKHPKEQLSMEYLPKMNNIAKKLLSQAGIKSDQMESTDLVRQGQQGLWEAVRDFNPKVHNFKGLAARRIKARMRDHIRKQIGVSLPTQQRVKMLEEAQRNIQDTTKKEGKE